MAFHRPEGCQGVGLAVRTAVHRRPLAGCDGDANLVRRVTFVEELTPPDDGRQAEKNDMARMIAEIGGAPISCPDVAIWTYLCAQGMARRYKYPGAYANDRNPVRTAVCGYLRRGIGPARYPPAA